MKSMNFFLLAVCLLVYSACKKERNENVTVIRDCTGTYLKFEGNDYHVCNLELVNSFADDEEAVATFKKIKECTGSAMDQIVCEMYHKTEGWIEVIKIE